MKRLFTLMMLLFATGAFAQVGLTENFNYAGSDTLTANGWFVTSGGTTNALRATATGLTFSGYPGSGIGAAAFVNNNGQDAYKQGTDTLASNNLYASFLVNVDTAQAAGDYFFALLPTTSTSSYMARVFAQRSSNDFYKVAISKQSETAVYSKDSFHFDSTYLFVIKYVFNVNTNTDDSIFLYVFKGSAPPFEPPFVVAKPVGATATDAAYFMRVALRQGTASNAPKVIVDGIRMGKTWSDVVVGSGGGPILPPTPISPAVMGTGMTTAKITWIKPMGYNDSSTTTLVFLKKGSAVGPGTPMKHPSVYTPNSNFSIGGTPYEVDTAAKCVMNSDSTGVDVTGLSPNTVYHAILYSVRTGDSTYSVSTSASGSTFGAIPPPAPVKFLTTMFPSPYSVIVNYVKDTGYRDSTHSILAFMKKGPPINIGTPKKPASVYTADPMFGAGSGYENDSMARCVYNGDSAKFQVNGLSPSSIYHFLVLVVRGGDTAYSIAVFRTDSTGGFKPGTPSGFKFSNVGTNSAMLTWNKPAGYVDSSMTTLVFLKENTGIPGGYLSQDPSIFVPNSFFPMAFTALPLDTAARCVFSADSNKVLVTGLNMNTMYYAVIYVVNKADSHYYSMPAYTNTLTIALPPSVFSLVLNPTGQNTARVYWKKPLGYNNTDFQTLVFMKQDSVINPGMPTKPASVYTANANFGMGGTSFEHDSLAHCVFSGDTSHVDVTGLNMGTKYFALVYVVRQMDSSYSFPVLAYATTFGAILPPAPLSMFSGVPVGTSAAMLNWVKDSMYHDSSHSVLVFAKKLMPVLPGNPMKHISTYMADTVFNGTGTRFEMDTAAVCVYNGDGNSVQVSGLDPGMAYHFVAFVSRDMDTLYSSAKPASVVTALPPPAPATNVQVTGLSMSSARITWTKPVPYLNSGHTTLVFVKEGGPIFMGKPMKPASAFTPSSLFGLGMRFDADTNAFTVYRGDTNFVVVTNLKRGTMYHVVVFNQRDGDTAYATGAIANGTVLPLPPVYPIGVIATVNPSTGVPDSNNVKVRVRGVTYGYNQRATGLQFVIRDATGGITLFRNTGNLGYSTYAEGDSVEAEGSVTTFRGLAEINLDTIILLGTGKSLKTPVRVTKVTEAEENDLIRIDTVSFITPPAGGIWPPTSSNFMVRNTKNDTIVLRVLNVSPLVGKPIPATPTFSVIGLGVQFSQSSSAPYAFNGYQLFPRTSADLIEIYPDSTPPQDTLLKFNLISPPAGASIALQGDPTATITLNWGAAKSTVTGVTPLYTVSVDTIGGSWTLPVINQLSGSSGSDTSLTLSLANISTTLGLSLGQTYAGQWRVTATGGTFKRYSDSIFTITFNRGLFNSLDQVSHSALFAMYPNPATQVVNLKASSQLKRVVVYDQLGRMMENIQAGKQEVQLDIADWNPGFYFVYVETGSGNSVQKLRVD